MQQAQNDLIKFLRRKGSRALSPAIDALAKEAVAHHPGTLALLFYGSCLRDDGTEGKVADLYLLVEDLETALGHKLSALACSLLPPNVYYLEVAYEDKILRAKYALLTLSQFEKGTTAQRLHPYLWARFAQPVALKITAEGTAREEVTARVSEALANAAVTTASEAVALLPEAFGVEDLWAGAFSATYRTELRAEKPGRALSIVRTNQAYYNELTPLVLASVPGVERDDLKGEQRYYATITRLGGLRAGAKWILRRFWGKLLSVARLMKAAFTFNGGARYIAWKIERHSGHHIEVKPWMERHPILAALTLFFRLYKKGAFR